MFLRNLTLAAVLLLQHFPAAAQNLYLRAMGGDAIPVSFGDQLQIDGYPYSGVKKAEPGHYVQYRDRASLSAGSWARVAAGYKFRRKLALELSLDQAIQSRRFESNTELPGPGRPRSTVQLQCYSPQMLGLTLAWTQQDLRQGICFSLGLMLPLSRRIESVTETRTDSAVFRDERSYFTKFSPGLRAAMGYRLPITARISAMAEISFLAMVLSAEEARLTSSTRNGVDVMPGKSEREKRVVYSEAFMGSVGSSPDDPAVMPKYQIPFANIGLHAGLIVLLGS